MDLGTDINVVMEKLFSFETADDLADYFHDYGIVARPRNAMECPISTFVAAETGIKNVVTTNCSLRVENSQGEQLIVFPHSDAMNDFVERYDKGFYSYLVETGYEVIDIIFSSGN
jgi:hypothetical protein